MLTCAGCLSPAVASGQDFLKLWQRSIPDAMTIADVAADDAGGVYVGGNIVPSLAEAYVMRLDANGTELWMRRFQQDPAPSGGSLIDLQGVAATADGVVVAGGVSTEDAESDVWVRKYSAGGDILWDRQFGTARFDGAADVAVSSTGAVYTTGFLNSGPDTTREDADIFLRKYSPDGTEIWTIQIDHPAGGVAAKSVAVQSDDLVYIGGHGFVMAFNGTGQHLWTRDAALPFHALDAGSSGLWIADADSLRRLDAGGAALWQDRLSAHALAVDDAGAAYARRRQFVFSCPTFGIGTFLICSITTNNALAHYDAEGTSRWHTTLPAGAGPLDDSSDGAVFVAVDVSVVKLARRQQVSIDVHPGTADPSLNTSSRGVVPVAVLTTTTFDARTVAPASICFGGTSPTACAEAHGRGHLDDVDHDGDQDLLLHYPVPATGLEPGDQLGCLVGKTNDGVVIAGCTPIVAR